MGKIARRRSRRRGRQNAHQHKKISTPRTAARRQPPDYGPSNIQSHGFTIEPNGEGGTRARNPGGNVLRLYWLRSSPHRLSEPQYATGLWLGALYYRAGLSPRCISKYSDMISYGSIQNVHADYLDARDLFNKIIKTLPFYLRSVIIRVCCDNEAAGRGNVKLLKEGLSMLEKIISRIQTNRLHNSTKYDTV